MDNLQRLRKALGVTNRTIVTVQQLNADGSAVVTHLNGSTSVVIAAGVGLGKAYLEGDKLVGKAPDLPYSEISV